MPFRVDRRQPLPWDSFWLARHPTGTLNPGNLVPAVFDECVGDLSLSENRNHRCAGSPRLASRGPARLYRASSHLATIDEMTSRVLECSSAPSRMQRAKRGDRELLSPKCGLRTQRQRRPERRRQQIIMSVFRPFPYDRTAVQLSGCATGNFHVLSRISARGRNMRTV